MRSRSRLASVLLFLIVPFFASASQDLDISRAGGVTGSVTSVSGNLITVLNGAVTIDTTGASFHSRRGSATIADVRPGAQIVATIRNPQAPAGTLLQASNIVILDGPAGTLAGPVQSVDAAGFTLTVFGARVLVTPETRFVSPMTGRNASLADIKAGDMVIVEVGIRGSGLVAETIHVVPPVPNTVLDGTVKSMSATAWVITTRSGDVSVTINAETRIDPSVIVGDSVHVIGTADAAGHVTALSIVRSIPRPVEPPLDAIEGTVKSIGATAWVITAREGKEVTVGIDRLTRIDPAIKAGDAVVVLTRRDAAGNLFAVAIMKSMRRRSTSH